MTARLKELQKRLLQDIGKDIVRFGFDAKPIGQTFYRKQPFGYMAFHVTFIPHANIDFDVTGDVAVRIDAVESLVNEDNKLLSKSERAQTATLGAELGNISRGQPLRWTVVGDEDIHKVSSGLVDAFERIGMPYLERFSVLGEVLCVLSSNEPSAWLHSPLHGSRCQRALALAFVMQQGNIDNIIEQSEAFLKSKNDFGLKSFQKFVERIRMGLKK